jgi:hypothetical protein
MKKQCLAAVVMTSVLLACGGGGSDRNANGGDSAAPPQSAASFQGTWEFKTFFTDDTCDRNVDDGKEFTLFLHVNNANKMYVKTAAGCGKKWDSTLYPDGFSISTIADVMSCGNGTDAAFVETISCLNIQDNQGEGSWTYEVSCPQRGCRLRYEGTCTKTSDEVPQDEEDCGTGSGGTSPAQPTAAPTAPPATGGSCGQCNLQGCCSHHGGVASCPGGPVVCGDGTSSPSCTC